MIMVRTAIITLVLCTIGPATARAQAKGTGQASQPPPPVAEERIDVDGDGTPDLVRIENPAAVAITITRPGNAKPIAEWKPFASAEGTVVSGEITAGAGPRFGGERVLVATALFRAPQRRGPIRSRARTGQAMVLAWRNGRLVKLWEGPVGAQGSHNGYQVRVTAADAGLLRFQERSDIQRCDGAPAYLFPERFDFKKRRFRAVSSPIGVPEGALVLTASQEMPDGMAQTPAISFRTRSVSAQSYAAHAGDLVPPRELDDDDIATAWQEGTGGAGRGVFITLTSPMADPEIAALRLVPGDASSDKAFERANRLRRVGLLIGTEHAFWVEFPADPARARPFDAPYWIPLPAGVRGDCVTLVIESVYPGKAARSANSGDTAIAELAVLTTVEVDRDGPDSELVARIVSGGDKGEAAARVLVRRGARAVPTLVDELEKSGLEPAAALRLRRLLARIGDSSGAAQLVEGLTAVDLSEADGELFASALARLGESAVPPLAELSRDEKADSAARVYAARILASMPMASARDSLIAVAGVGDRALRKTVAVGLGQRDVADFVALIDALERASGAPSRSAESDLWRALGLMARRAEPALRERAGRALAERLATSSDYELSYRLLHAAAGLDQDTALEAVGAALARVRARTDPKSVALRRVSAIALAENPNPRARQLLVGMAADDDPGTRGLVVAALGPRGDADDESDRAIIDRLGDRLGDRLAGRLDGRLGGEPWTHVRRRAASALGHRCGTSTAARDALDRTVDQDPHIDVQREALGSLVECRAHGIGPRLLAIAGDGERSQELRQRALSLVPALEDPSLAPELIALFSTLRGRAWSDATSVRLAAATAVAMGRLGTPDVVKPLMSAAKEASFPEIQAAAITGLGELCPPQALPLMAALLGSGERRVAIAAQSAYNQCRR